MLRNSLQFVTMVLFLGDPVTNVMLIRRNLTKNPKSLDETLVKDVTVVTPLVNLVKMVLPANHVTLPKSLVTVMIASVEETDEEARVTLLANLAKTTRKKLKIPLKLPFSDETW